VGTQVSGQSGSLPESQPGEQQPSAGPHTWNVLSHEAAQVLGSIHISAEHESPSEHSASELQDALTHAALQQIPVPPQLELSATGVTTQFPDPVSQLSSVQSFKSSQSVFTLHALAMLAKRRSRGSLVLMRRVYETEGLPAGSIATAEVVV
jgi:hypothetical protein